MSRALLRQAAALALAFGVAACSVGPDFEAPKAPDQTTYTAEPVTLPADQRFAEGEKLRADWWALLHSPDLDRTVEQAVAGNWSLASVKARLARSEEGIRVAGAKLMPQVDASSDIARNHYGASFLGPQAKEFPLFSAYSAGATVSYDLDLFGRNRRGVEKARAEADIAQEEVDAALLTLTGNVALQAVQIASVKAQLAAVGRIVESDQKTLDLVRAARGSGAITDIDVLAAQSQLDRDRTLLPALRQQLSVAEDALATLVGKSPAEWRAPDFALDGFVLPVELPVAVPSELVRIRPDIRAAEARLHAASAAIGMAEADFYPNLSLSADFAEQGLTGGAAGAAFGLLGGVTLPIFHGGELTARKEQANDAYQASLADYRQAVVSAFGQVADQLHALGNDSDQLDSETRSLSSSTSTLKLTRLGYGVGNASVVQVLDAQRQSEQSELGAIRARAQRYTDTIKLFLAMGGGHLPATRTAGL
jgi:NodT family efflux transporter outer membrane factor (OMF) lipoprotein